jgi:hypothetical protein
MPNIKTEHGSRFYILAKAGYTPQDIVNKYPEYHADQVRNYLKRKYPDLKGELKKDTSRGNSKLIYVLKEMFPNTKVHSEYPIGQKLRLDSYIDHPYFLGFEFDGVQHFKSVDHFGGDDQHIKNIQNDFKKDEICKGRGISLIRLNSLDDLTIESLDKLIQEHGYGTGLIEEKYRTNTEKKEEYDEKRKEKSKKYAKENYKKTRQKYKQSEGYKASKEKAKQIRKQQYQKQKAWAANRKNRTK